MFRYGDKALPFPENPEPIESFKSHKQLKEAITFPSKTNLRMTVPRGEGRAGR